MTAEWLVPTLFYILAAASLGVTSKLALRDVRWPHLILWSAVGYVCMAIVMLVAGRARPRLVEGSGWAALTAVLVITALLVLYVALTSGEAARVVPVSAAYPVVTLLLAALFLSEAVTVTRATGVVLVVGGAAIVTGAR